MGFQLGYHQGMRSRDYKRQVHERIHLVVSGVQKENEC